MPLQESGRSYFESRLGYPIVLFKAWFSGMAFSPVTTALSTCLLLSSAFRTRTIGYIAQKAAEHGASNVEVWDSQEVMGSDNGPFSGFVPQTMLAFGSEQGGYSHSPYDTLKTAQGLGDLMEQVTAVTLSVALDIGPDAPELRGTPPADRRALIVASHTEVLQMSPSTLIDLELALTWEGFDVDVLLYGQPVIAAEMDSSDLVVVLPVIDYPSANGDPTLYDEAWTEEEITTLVDYVNAGGLLVLTNSGHRVLFGIVMDENEDWQDMNDLADRFDISYNNEPISGEQAQVQQVEPFFNDVPSLVLVAENGLSFTMENGEILASVDNQAVVGFLSYGNGQILVLADAGILGWAEFMPPEQDNLIFFRNLAAYAHNQ